MSSVSVRPRPRLLPPRRAERTSPDLPGLAAYTSPAMQITTTPAPKSTIELEIELPPERLDKAIQHAVQHLSRRTRVPGFRPGKAPRQVLERALGPGAVLDDAVEHLVQDAYREALVEKDILPLTNADVEVVQAEEGKPLVFKATVQVRPEVKLGDYKGFNFGPEIETIDDARVAQVIEELRDQNATLTAVEGRGAKDGDYAVIAFVGTRDGTPFEGGTSERMPLILGQERLIPGFETNLVGLEVRRLDRVRHHVPRGLRRARAGRCDRPLRGRHQGAPREGPAGPRRRLRPPDGRVRGPRRPAGRHQDAARGQRARQGPPRLRRQDHRIRRRQRDARPARRARRPGGRGDARRVPRLDRPPGHHRGGVSQGRWRRRTPTSMRTSGPPPRSA